ncbi:MAG: acetolactate synthase [Anaeromassilibacillus sp.]
MQIQQISVFVENKSGRLAEITMLAAANGISGRFHRGYQRFGILRLIVNKPKEAVEALKAAGLTVSLTSVIAMGIDDQPGEFAKAMRVLADNQIGVEYIYAFVSREHGKAFVILRVDDSERAVNMLRENGITILSAEEIYDL